MNTSPAPPTSKPLLSHNSPNNITYQQPTTTKTRLVVQLLITNLLSLRLLPRQKPTQPPIRIPTNHQPRRNRRLPPRHNALPAHLLTLTPINTNDVLLALGTLLQREEDNRLAIVDEFTGGLLDDGELGVDGGERGVAERVGFGDVGRDVLVGLGEVGEEGVGEFV